jgi:hypothetical protein
MTVRIIGSILYFWIVPAHCMYCITGHWIGYAEKTVVTIERGILGKTKATSSGL